MLAAAAEKSSKPYYLMSSRPGVMNQHQVKALRECGLVQIGGTRQGLGAIDRVGRYMMEQPQPLAPAVKRRAALRDLLAANSSRRVLNELDAKQLLAEYGLPVTREHRVATLAEAMTAARKIGYPVVLKGLSDDIPHKTELGLVAVALADEKRLADAFANLRERMAWIEPPPREAAFLVQEARDRRHRGVCRISRDPDFGLALAFGMGEPDRGHARLYVRMLPLRGGGAQAMIAETRGAALLGPCAAARGRRRKPRPLPDGARGFCPANADLSMRSISIPLWCCRKAGAHCGGRAYHCQARSKRMRRDQAVLDSSIQSHGSDVRHGTDYL